MFKTKEAPRREMMLAAAPSRAKPMSKAAAVPSIVSADMTIHGNMNSLGDLQVEGEVIGDIDVDTLMIAAGGIVIGHVTANEVRISGCLTGSVRADTVTLAATAVVVGDSFHRLLTIETGATLEGQSRRLIMKEAVEMEPGAPAPAAPEPAAPEPAPPAQEAEPEHHHHEHGEHHEHHQHNGEYHQH
jgi:cytoskeletal protein CcmA (bactofilin family)